MRVTQAEFNHTGNKEQVSKNCSICWKINAPFWVLFPAPWLSLSGNPSLSGGFWSFCADCLQILNQLLSQITINSYFYQRMQRLSSKLQSLKKTFITTLHLHVYMKKNLQNPNLSISNCLINYYEKNWIK